MGKGLVDFHFACKITNACLENFNAEVVRDSKSLSEQDEKVLDVASSDLLKLVR